MFRTLLFYLVSVFEMIGHALTDRNGKASLLRVFGAQMIVVGLVLLPNPAVAGTGGLVVLAGSLLLALEHHAETETEHLKMRIADKQASLGIVSSIFSAIAPMLSGIPAVLQTGQRFGNPPKNEQPTEIKISPLEALEAKITSILRMVMDAQIPLLEKLRALSNVLKEAIKECEDIASQSQGAPDGSDGSDDLHTLDPDPATHDAVPRDLSEPQTSHNPPSSHVQ